jgi:hypothetical protein
MASNTKSTESKRKRRHKNMGRRRKAKLSKKSTLSETELFAVLAESGKAAK